MRQIDEILKIQKNYDFNLIPICNEKHIASYVVSNSLSLSGLILGRDKDIHVNKRAWWWVAIKRSEIISRVAGLCTRQLRATPTTSPSKSELYNWTLELGAFVLETFLYQEWDLKSTALLRLPNIVEWGKIVTKKRLRLYYFYHFNSWNFSK